MSIQHFHCGKWTDEETCYLLKNWKTSTLEDLARVLQRNYVSIKSKAVQLKLGKRTNEAKVHKSWCDTDIQYLTEHWNTTQASEISTILHRSERSVRAQAYKLRLLKRKFWTSTEIHYLTKYWADTPDVELMKALQRDWDSIATKAGILSLGKRNREVLIRFDWTTEEDNYLTLNWEWTPKEEILKILNDRNWSSIKRRAQVLKLPGRQCFNHNSIRFKSHIDGEEYAAYVQHGYLISHKNRKTIPVHRAEMEKIIGRPLKPQEKVHHKNGIKNDNRPENLMIFDSQKRHAHIDTDRAETAEQFIKDRGLIEEYRRYYGNKKN